MNWWKFELNIYGRQLRASCIVHSLCRRFVCQLHFNFLTTSSSILTACACEAERGRAGVQPHSQEDHFFIMLRNTRRNGEVIIQRDKLSETDRREDGETGTARPSFGNLMERLASRQHLGRIIESLEKTGAPEPLSCVNVALQVLPTACAHCLVLRVYTVASLSICKYIKVILQFLYEYMYYLNGTWNSYE